MKFWIRKLKQKKTVLSAKQVLNCLAPFSWYAISESVFLTSINNEYTSEIRSSFVVISLIWRQNNEQYLAQKLLHDFHQKSSTLGASLAIDGDAPQQNRI